MYKNVYIPTTKMKINEGYEGETIEKKVRRIVHNNEPITDGAPLIYTDRKDGVNPDHNIRTDKWVHAIDAMDQVTRTHLAKREDRHKPPTDDLGDKAKEGMNKEGQQPSNTN